MFSSYANLKILLNCSENMHLLHVYCTSTIHLVYIYWTVTTRLLNIYYTVIIQRHTVYSTDNVPEYVPSISIYSWLKYTALEKCSNWTLVMTVCVCDRVGDSVTAVCNET